MDLSKRSIGIFAALCVVVAASCSRSDGETATTAPPPTPAPTAAAATTAAVTPDATPDPTEPAGAASETTVAVETTPPAPVAGPGDFGTLTGVCGPAADGAPPAVDGEQGVTADSIVVGTVSDPGNTIAPGLNQELFDSADAFVGWCNAAGGINGRQLKLNKHDAKLFEAGPAMVEACQTDFMLVGGGMALDDTAVEPRVACGLPQIAGYTTSSAAGRADGSIMAMANSDYMTAYHPLYRTLAELDPSVLPNWGMINLQLPSIAPTGLRGRAMAKTVGFTEVYYEEAPAQVDNFRPYVEKLKQFNVQVLTHVSSYEVLVQMLKVMEDVGYFPKYIVLGSNYYNPNFVAEAGSLLDKTKVLIVSSAVPFELAGDDYPATAKYVSILDEYAGGAAPKQLGINSISSWLLWATAARDCGADLSRACVMEKAKATTDWTAGGMHAPVKPDNLTGSISQCMLVLQATGAGYSINEEFTKANDGIFNCDPSNATAIPGFP